LAHIQAFYFYQLFTSLTIIHKKVSFGSNSGDSAEVKIILKTIYENAK